MVGSIRGDWDDTRAHPPEERMRNPGVAGRQGTPGVRLGYALAVTLAVKSKEEAARGAGRHDVRIPMHPGAAWHQRAEADRQCRFRLGILRITVAPWR